MLEIEFASFTDPGRVRSNNEDYFGQFVPATPDEARARGWLFALADGVGGQDDGEIASSTAVERLLSGFRESIAGEPPAALLTRLIQTANTEVYEKGRMATTIVACAFRHDRVAIAHAGDSRCYLIRQGESRVLTRDHTVVNDQMRLGLLSTKEAAEADTKHVLSRSVGSNLFINVESSEHQIFKGDTFLLCSDGLHGAMEPAQIARIIQESTDLASTARKLVAFAYDRDGSDNISVQLIRILDVERVGMYRGRPYKLQ